MQDIIYDVAVSIDGYISGPSGAVEGFAHSGPVVEEYRARLETYHVAIMGRATYEFAYAFGLTLGQNPYPHMRTLVFSQSLKLPVNASVEQVSAPLERVLPELKRTATGPIYLCGGGQFAGAVLDLGLIDRLRLKRAPLVLGSGTPLFAGIPAPIVALQEQRDYGHGLIYQDYKLEAR